MGVRPTSLHHTELPSPEPGSPVELECQTYRQEVGRLLAEGFEGKYVLLKGTTIIGIYSTEEEAMKEGYRRYLHEPFLVHRIRTHERVYCTRNWL